MRKAIVAAVLLGLSVLACGKTSDMAVVEGRVLGADGKPPVLAHVHLMGLGDSYHESLKSTKVGADGAFSVSVPRDGYYELAVTAVNHQAVRIPLAVDLKRGIKGLEVTLAANRYVDAPAGIGIMGDWNDFEAGAAEMMTPLGDGTFAFERKVEADTLAYQLLGATPDGRSVNGTDADHYLYDGGGDYRSVVLAEGETARVIFDPKKGVVPVLPGLPSVELPSKKHPVGEMFEISNLCWADLDSEASAMQQYWAEHGTPAGFVYDASALKRDLLEKISGAGSLAARKYAAAKLASLLDRDVPLGPDEVSAVGKILSPVDAVWADNPASLGAFYTLAEGGERTAELFERNLAKVSDKTLKAVMLLEIGMRAREVGDSAKQRAIYDDLSKNYADDKLPIMVQYRIASELDPNLRVNKGKPLPDFEFALLDGSGKVSKQSLLGKYCLIDLWATWCMPCVGEMANLHRACEKFRGPKFEMLSISFDESPEDVAEFRAGQWKMPWLNAYSEGVFQSEAAKVFEVAGIPKPILVDPNGTIVESGMGLRGDNLLAIISRYVGE